MQEGNMALKKKKKEKGFIEKTEQELFSKPLTKAQEKKEEENVQEAEKKVEHWISTARLQSLTDGIFAFAMTLLVLNLILPDPANLPPETQLNNLLLGQLRAFYNYILSFILLAIFWTIHSKQFHAIKGTTQTHTWINLAILLFVVLIPFSTSVMADYPDDTTANILFATNMLVVGIAYFLNWAYASSEKHKLLETNIDAIAISISKRRGMIIPIVSVLAIIVAIYSPEYTGLCFLLIPILTKLKQFNR